MLKNFLIDNEQITALIAVKGDSERVPKKNIRPFAGSSLLEVKLQQLHSANIFGEILVSSENDDILSKCESYNVRTHKRDSFYSTPTGPMSDVYRHLASQVKTKYIAWIPVTNPLVNESIYKNAVNVFRSMDHTKHDSLLSVSEVHEYLYYNNKPLNFSRDPWLRSQDLTGVHAINFAINIISKQDMMKNGATLGNNPKFFVIPEELAIDIDYMNDFIFAEVMYKQQKEKELYES